MAAWLDAALGYIPAWLDWQMNQARQPGCSVAVAHRGEVVLERAFGLADEATGRKLTPAHRFRVASHSKTFTATAVLKLREEGRLGLDDPAGRYVDGLHPDVARATVEQLLSHGSGLVRDGADAGQWEDARRFLDADELRAGLRAPLVLPGATRFKYSNHAFGLLGLIVETVTGEPYGDHMRRSLLAPMGLDEIAPDMPLAGRWPFATGHSRLLPLGRRVPIAGDNPTRALASATGFVASARQLVRFFASLDPAAKDSPLSPDSRREMIRRRWADPHAAAEVTYGLGVMGGSVDGWSWFGHGGAFQGSLSRTAVVPGRDLAVSVVTNAIDGPATDWANGLLHILATFETRGAPPARLKDWSGRWWSLWETVDLVPVADRVLMAAPNMLRPFDHAGEIEVTGRDRGVVALDGGYGVHGEPAALVRKAGKVTEVRVGGSRAVPEARHRAALRRRAATAG